MCFITYSPSFWGSALRWWWGGVCAGQGRVVVVVVVVVGGGEGQGRVRWRGG
jgi:hypothetical protein